ncbi:putative ferric-chelate reductase 1 homolog isoform X2 [Amblyomma americanum]
MATRFPFFLAVLLVLLGTAVPYHTGAPQGACDAMVPGHGAPSESGADSYQLTAEKQPDQTVRVTLTGTFKGFLIQARKADDVDSLVPGKFVPVDNATTATLSCLGDEAAALTHTDGDVKSQVKATWIPPANWAGEVVFRATVVQDYSHYVERILSSPVSIEKSPHLRNEDTATTPATSGAYAGCGQTMGCFGTPKGCLTRGSCSLLLTYVARGDGVDFELSAPARHEEMWIAAGISETPSMDMASVVECLRHNGLMSMRESWNADNKRNIPIANQTPGLTFTRRDYSDGMLRCSWHRAHVTSVQKTTFNTATNSYHLLLAAGQFDGNTDIKKEHYERDYTKAPVNLKAMQVALGGAGSDIFIKLHGSLMVVAWVLLVSVGILLARHYKNVWEATTICGVKPWFAFHRVLMMLAVAMTIAGLVLIFYRIGQWSVTENPHPILGIVCSVLGFLQPIMALFRCHPHEDNRYIFNWGHWFNGNAAQIIGVAAIFFATGLEKAQLKGADWFVYILAAFIGFHVLVHIIMQLHSALMSKKTASNDIKMQDMPAGNGVHNVEPGRDSQPPADAPGGGFRRFILGIYLVVAILVVAALVSTIWFSTAP